MPILSSLAVLADSRVAIWEVVININIEVNGNVEIHISMPWGPPLDPLL
jgi:hypothetical protein